MNLHHSDSKAPKSSKRKLVGWIVGLVVGTLVGTLFGFIFSLLVMLDLDLIKGESRWVGSGPTIYSPFIKKAENLVLLVKQDGFASSQIIGKSGCGEVYKDELPRSNGKMISIKNFVQSPKDAAK
ncbi:hypothetical protein SESBI_03060 [Sesbania bispinosa]|nr:hypothetical protein SESBI_03060 [Sesbania bispinosa]